MHKVTYALVAGVFFWAGTVHEAAREPVQQFKRVSPEPEKLNLNLFPCDPRGKREYERTCRAKFRSALIKPLER